MLKLTYLNENFDLARLALTHWAHDEETLPERMMWFRVSANAVYPFDWEGKLCFLRLTPAEEKSAVHVRAELDFLTHLQRADYPAMRPIPTLDDQLLLNLSTPWGVWHACAFTGVPGRQIEDIPLTEEVLTRYGAALGRLHCISMALDSPLARPAWMDALDWAWTYIEQGPGYIQEEYRAVRKALSCMPEEKHTFGLVHYDFEPDNVFFDGESCHAIDFDDSMYHFYAIDLVQALDELPREAHAAFLAGYYAACPQSGAKEEDFPLMRRFRDLYSWARVMHALSDIPKEQPDWMPGLIGMLTKKLHALEETILNR
ncbi:MAG: phosphotransferase [Clostridia bacterium]|nr:phosphotransferase [Clostridia bacterium]